jgi:hypothetical protein
MRNGSKNPPKICVSFAVAAMDRMKLDPVRAKHAIETPQMALLDTCMNKGQGGEFAGGQAFVSSSPTQSRAQLSFSS